MEHVSRKFLNQTYHGKKQCFTTDCQSTFAGIDIGSRMHVVAVDQNVENVRSFGVYHNMRRVNSRGMARANKHFLTAAICYNLKKLLKFNRKNPNVKAQSITLKK
ncbi:Uncharacterised protein [Sphingobacterium daejeonense]|nr:Uncharacterised protein [Sphingobacterium daejeonense]